MDKIAEVKKLKELLDEGLITEEDFTNQKRKVLELEDIEIVEEKQLEKESVLQDNEERKVRNIDDYEKELIEETKLEEDKEDKEEKKDEQNEYYEKEKIKERAKLEAKEEIRKQRIEEREQTIQKGVTKLKTVLKWILTVFLILMGIGSFMSVAEGIIAYLVAGIIFILLGLMACPTITNITNKYEMYTKYKKNIVIIMTVILLALMAVAGSQLAV